MRAFVSSLLATSILAYDYYGSPSFNPWNGASQATAPAPEPKEEPWSYKPSHLSYNEDPHLHLFHKQT